MDVTAPTNPAGVSVPDDDITGDAETESARSRSVLGRELQIITAREGQVALTEAALRSHTGYTPTSVVPSLAAYRPSAIPVPGTVTRALISAPTLVPTLVSNTYNQQNNTILQNDNGLLIEAANARHQEIVGRTQNENREQMMNLELTANSQVAQLRLEHARLENRTREMEEMANQNALRGQQAVAHHQSAALAASEQAQALHQRLMSAESSANAVVAEVEAEAIVASDSPDKAHVWLSKVWDKEVDEKELRDSEGFSTLDAKIMSALTNIIEGDFGRQTDTFKETEALAGRMVRGRQLLHRLHNYFATNALHGSVYDMEDLMNCNMVNNNLTVFLRNWDTILSGIPIQPDDNSVLEPLFHRQVKKCKVIAHDVSVYDRALEGNEQKSYQFLYNAANNHLERERLQKNRDRIARQAGGAIPTIPADAFTFRKDMSSLPDYCTPHFHVAMPAVSFNDAVQSYRFEIPKGNDLFPIEAPCLPIEWIADTGSAQDLIAERELGHATPFESGNPISMMTASGPNSANKQCDVSVDSIGVQVTPYVLPDTPSVLSIGQRCKDEGFDFVWRANSRPYLRSPEGKEVFMDVKDNVPYLKVDVKISATGRSAPPGSEEDSHNHREYQNNTVCLGDYKGGELWIHDPDANPESERYYCAKAKDGTKLPGKLHSTRHRVLNFNPKTYHAVRPWKGDRWSITSYVNRAVHKLNPEQLAQLKEYGFHVPSKVSAPSSLLISPEDEGKTLFDLVSDEIDKELAVDLASKPKVKSKGSKEKEKKPKSDLPSSTKPAPPTEEEIAEAAQLIEEYGTDAEDDPADDPGSVRPPEGEAPAPDGEFAEKAKKRSKGVEALKAEARSMHHLMTHQPKNPYCDVCQRAKMYQTSFACYRGDQNASQRFSTSRRPKTKLRIDYWVGPEAKRKDRDRFAPTSEILVLPIKDLNRNDFHECLTPISAYQFKDAEEQDQQPEDSAVEPAACVMILRVSWVVDMVVLEEKAIEDEARELARKELDNQDCWKVTDDKLVRYHFVPRRELFSPDLTDCPLG
ncbi:unnamed protein product [Symbiodinium sp. KB8]|nr:unnamed protein product [Symbiodinium sp. KB8]